MILNTGGATVTVVPEELVPQKLVTQEVVQITDANGGQRVRPITMVYITVCGQTMLSLSQQKLPQNFLTWESYTLCKPEKFPMN